jgi:N-acetylornithine carbamoyltransferase
MKAFNDLSDYSIEEIKELLELSGRLEKKPEPNALVGRVLSLLFLSPSLRTLASFQAAMARLGGNSFVITPDKSIHELVTQYGIPMDGAAAEHIREAVPVIASYGDAIGIRVKPSSNNGEVDLLDSEFRSLIDLIDIPYINMESSMNHPCQSLGDWKTLDDFKVPSKCGKFVLSWVFHPEPQPISVPASVLHMAAYRGMDVTVLRPEGLELPQAVIQKAEQAAAVSGGSVSQTDDKAEAMAGAHILYARSWAPQPAARLLEDHDFRNKRADWCVDESWFRNAAKDCRFMHCMPVRRGVEVKDAILDGVRSIIIREAQNRMYIQMAILHRMLARVW